MRKRTSKQFVDYNDYHDRPFGLKWGTAFALDELMRVVNTNKQKASKTVFEHPIMSREQIDVVLQQAFLKSRLVMVQTYERDEYGNLIDEIEGKFEGRFSVDLLYIDDRPIPWDNIRHIRLK